MQRSYKWVHATARMLDNPEGKAGKNVRARLAGLLGAMKRLPEKSKKEQTIKEHFIKITRNYWKQLFFCYDVADLPRTNNDLEKAFGAFRHAQRRATGRKSASRSEVLRGPARITASLANRIRQFTAQDLATADPAQWRATRKDLEERRRARTAGKHFRKDPATFLKNLESKLLKLILPD